MENKRILPKQFKERLGGQFGKEIRRGGVLDFRSFTDLKKLRTVFATTNTLYRASHSDLSIQCLPDRFSTGGGMR